MTDRDQPTDDPKFEAYLDGSLAEEARRNQRVRVENDAELREQAALQGRIDEALRSLFPPVQAPESAVARLTDESREKAIVPMRRLVMLAAAAALAGVALTWLFEGRPSGPITPHFEPTPLAQLYRNALAEGFRPYYDCREPERFAAVFARRQGQPLALLPMPEGTRMLGISYPGGLSRDTTAILCTVDGAPVMLLVDREEADAPNIAMQGADDLNVFRTVRDGLVIYEVSPLKEPRATRYLKAM